MSIDVINAEQSTLRFSVNNLCKAYAAPVLKGLSFDLHKGEVFGLVGENGAGKSTLINIICGLVKADKGSLALNQEGYCPQNVADAMRQGVSFASQELSLIDELSIAQNISLRKLPHTGGKINADKVNQKASALLAKFALSNLDPLSKVASLSLAQKQLLELCKALSEDCQLLILDEPTAALSQQQSDTLHTIIQNLAQNGVSVIYVSHRLQDIVDQCHRIAVLRDGELVETFRGKKPSFRPYAEHEVHVAHTIANTQALISAMSKGTLNTVTSAAKLPQSTHPIKHGKPVLSMQNCTTSDLPSPISLDIYRGEIVGIAGLAGAGRTEVLEAIYGLSPLKSGQVIVTQSTNTDKTIESPNTNHTDHTEQAKHTAIKNTAHATQLGIGMLSQDRKQQGIFAQQSLAFNASIADLANTTRRALLIDTLSFSAIKHRCADLFDRLGVKHNTQSQSIESLSGGNQQKVLLARWLFANSQILLLDEPSRGVDVAAKSVIYSELTQLKIKGASMLVVSSELEELFTYCDRILVMSNKQIAGELSPEQYSNEAALNLAFSKTAN